MATLSNIVAATDLSAASRHASDRAAQLARAHDVPLILVHALTASVLEELRRWSGDAAPAQAIENDARARLRALAAELKQRHGARITEQLVVGRPAQEITGLAERLDAGLIVTGTRGAGFMRGVVVGSTAERIANRARRPVLMVRQSVHEPYRRALVPVDFSPKSQQAVQLADRVAPQAALVLMHAAEVAFEGRMRLAGVSDSTIARYRSRARAEAQQRLGELAAATGLPWERLRLTTVEGGEPWMLIAQEEQEHDCDLIVIGRQGRHALDELLLGSTTRMVLAECSADVLVSIDHDDAANEGNAHG